MREAWAPSCGASGIDDEVFSSLTRRVVQPMSRQLCLRDEKGVGACPTAALYGIIVLGCTSTEVLAVTSAHAVVAEAVLQPSQMGIGT